MKSGAMTAAGAYASVAETTGLKPKDVKGAVEGLLAVAADQLKKNGSFKIGGALNFKLKSKPAAPARKGVNPFTKEPCVFKARPASKTVKGYPMKSSKRWSIETALSSHARDEARGGWSRQARP